MNKEDLFNKIYQWGINKEGQTLSEKECEELRDICLEYTEHHVIAALMQQKQLLEDWNKTLAEELNIIEAMTKSTR